VPPTSTGTVWPQSRTPLRSGNPSP
jgi:hypothetical protein